VCSNPECRKDLAFCSHCRDVSTYSLVGKAKEGGKSAETIERLGLAGTSLPSVSAISNTNITGPKGRNITRGRAPDFTRRSNRFIQSKGVATYPSRDRLLSDNVDSDIEANYALLELHWAISNSRKICE
jgi:hypothetical protein